MAKGLIRRDAMGARETVDLETRERLRRWMQWYVAPREKGGRGWTQTRLAETIGTSGASVSNILSGKASVGFDIFLLMRKGLGLSADMLLDEEPEYRVGR